MPKSAGTAASSTLPGPWFIAGFDGECDECGASITGEVDEIRRVASGWQGRECCGEDETPVRRDPFVAISTDEMGY